MRLSEILRNSTYSVDKSCYCIAKVCSSYDTRDCFMVTMDELETTVICKDSFLTKDNCIDVKGGYCRIAINVAIPFNSPGFIAAISEKMAFKEIPVLVVSTYSRDYFLIQEEMINDAILALEELGIKHTN